MYAVVFFHNHAGRVGIFQEQSNRIRPEGISFLTSAPLIWRCPKYLKPLGHIFTYRCPAEFMGESRSHGEGRMPCAPTGMSRRAQRGIIRCQSRQYERCRIEFGMTGKRPLREMPNQVHDRLKGQPRAFVGTTLCHMSYRYQQAERGGRLFAARTT